jgi:SAM-dependent methyltransferase
MKRNRTAKLEAGKFRLINEMLYTSNSSDSLDLFQKDPEYFSIYHQGFTNQISSWPVNPLSLVESEIRRLAKNDKWSIADLGCGQGQLALNLKDMRNLTVFSYDLVSSREDIIACDISNLPLHNQKIDCALFCLSLMGTNHVNMVKEAHRVLKNQGILIVAEVATRFNQKDFIRDMQMIGFKNIKTIIPNSFFSMFVFRKIKPSGSEPVKLLDPCKYKKR